MFFVRGHSLRKGPLILGGGGLSGERFSLESSPVKAWNHRTKYPFDMRSCLEPAPTRRLDHIYSALDRPSSSVLSQS